MYLFIGLSVLEYIHMPIDHVSVDKILPLSLHKLLDQNFVPQLTVYNFSAVLYFSFLMKASAQVYYWILDINDHLPHFPSQYYIVTVGEVSNAMLNVTVSYNVVTVIWQDINFN